MTPEELARQEAAAIREATGHAEMNPLRTAKRHLQHLVDAIGHADEHHARTGEHLRIKTVEAAAVADVLDTMDRRQPVMSPPAVNHPVIVALRWMLSLYGDSACMFGQSKHHPTACAACNAKWVLDCIENGGSPEKVAAWTAKHPDLVAVSLDGLGARS